MLSGRGLCDELITRPEESYRLYCVVVCDLETSRMGAPYIYDISHLRVNKIGQHSVELTIVAGCQRKGDSSEERHTIKTDRCKEWWSEGQQEGNKLHNV